MNILEKREQYRAFLKHAAHGQDRKEPLKALAQEGHQDDIRAMQVFGMLKVDDTTDDISVTIEGRMFAGMAIGDVPDFGPGKLAELRGTITETELAARYLEGKIGGVEKAMREGGDRDTLQWLGRILKATAEEFRQQMHVPAMMIDGRVIPYNEDNETGVKHQANLTLFFSDVHERNLRAGWWSDIETGEPKKRNLGELMILIVTEIKEAYDAWVMGAADDKLPQYPGFGVEIGDTLIRLADLCGAALKGTILEYDEFSDNPGQIMFEEVCEIAERYESIRKTPAAVGSPETADFLPPMDIAEMVDVKLAFNAQRPDHKIEARLAEDGKRT